MGQYFNPPQEIKAIARRIEGRTYEQLTAQLQPGEKLFGHFDRYIFQQCPHLYSDREFEEFQQQVRSGTIMQLGFYAMPEQVFIEKVERKS